MDKVRKHYDLDHVLNLCYGKSGADKNELHEFEVTTDLEHLPNSNAMKEYLRCFAEVTEAVETQSNRVLLTKVLKYLDDLTTAQRMIYINMSKGCLTRAGKVTDRLEYTYVLAVCCKQNDNEVN